MNLTAEQAAACAHLLAVGLGEHHRCGSRRHPLSSDELRAAEVLARHLRAGRALSVSEVGHEVGVSTTDLVTIKAALAMGACVGRTPPVSSRTVQRWVERDDIRGTKINGTWFVDADDVRRAIERKNAA